MGQDRWGWLGPAKAEPGHDKPVATCEPPDRKRDWRASGILMLMVMSVLMPSGLLLHYGSEEMRDGVVLTHWIAGFIAFAVFALHLTL